MATPYRETILRLGPDCMAEVGRLARTYNLTPIAVVRMTLEGGLTRSEPRAEKTFSRGAVAQKAS
jgi:hypothetical protein